MKYNAIIVGLGNIGLGYDLNSNGTHILTHTKAYLKNANFNLVAGIDIAADKRKSFEKYSRKRAFKTIENFKKINEERIDIVSLCTPENVRLPEFKKIISLKPKLIIIEKPIALTLKEANKMKQLADESKIKLYVNYTRRVDPFLSKLKEAFCSGEFGQPRLIKVNYTGGLYKNASHFIDLLMFYFGSPKNMKCLEIKKRKNSDFDATFILSYSGFDVFFNAVPIDDCFVCEVDIFLSRARVIMLDGGIVIKTFKVVKDPIFKGCFALKEVPLKIKPEPYRYQANVLNHIVEVLKYNKPLASDEKSAIATLLVCKRIENGF